MDEDNNSLFSGVDLDSELSIDPSMLSTPGDNGNSTTSFHDVNDMAVSFTDMIGSDGNIALLGQDDVPCDMSWSAHFFQTEPESTQALAVFSQSSSGQGSQCITQTSAENLPVSVPLNREHVVPGSAPPPAAQISFAEIPTSSSAVPTSAEPFPRKPIFSVTQQPASAPPPPPPAQNHHHQQQQANNPSARTQYRTVWPGWHAVNTGSSHPTPLINAPKGPKIYEYKPPTFGPNSASHSQKPQPADANGIRTSLAPREATADAMKLAFVKGAGWCLMALIRQINHELKTQGTMFGFKPDKKIRKQDVVQKTVTDYFQSNNPPTLAAISCAQDVGRLFGQYYPGLFLPFPGSAQDSQQQQHQQQQHGGSHLQQNANTPTSMPMFTGDGPVPAMYIATAPPMPMTTAPMNAGHTHTHTATSQNNNSNKTWSPVPQARPAAPSSPAPPTSANVPASNTTTTAPNQGISHVKTGKKKDKLYMLTGAYREITYNGEVSVTWQCSDNQYRTMDEVHGETPPHQATAATTTTAPTQGPAHHQRQAQTSPSQAYTTQPPVPTQQAAYTHMPASYPHLQQYMHQGQYIPAASPVVPTGHVYTYNPSPSPLHQAYNNMAQQHPQQQQTAYMLSPQHAGTHAVPKRRRAPDAESSTPLPKRSKAGGGQQQQQASCNPAELMLPQQTHG
jgi:hypothetical protein